GPGRSARPEALPFRAPMRHRLASPSLEQSTSRGRKGQASERLLKRAQLTAGPRSAMLHKPHGSLMPQARPPTSFSPRIRGERALRDASGRIGFFPENPEFSGKKQDLPGSAHGFLEAARPSGKRCNL